MALSRAAQPVLTDAEDFAEERSLAAAVVRQALQDLRVPGRRAEARRFLLERYPETIWRVWLPWLHPTALTRYVEQICLAPGPRIVDTEVPRPRREVLRVVQAYTGRRRLGAPRAVLTASMGPRSH